jgi:hypothetical protein
MSNLPTTAYNMNDYDAIELAVGSSERGRWFLAEFAKRNRVSDTQTVMSAIEKLQNVVASTLTATAAPTALINTREDTNIVVETLRNDLVEMARRITDTQTEVTAIGLKDSDPAHAALVSGELDAITQSIEFATSEILESAEEIQEIAWTLREGGLAVETCDAIDARSTKIYLACSFQDLTAQRTAKVIGTMRFLENRIHKMIGILQGVEGFCIAGSHTNDVVSSTFAQQSGIQENMAQDDVDSTFNWGREQKDKIAIDNWLNENEIEETLSPVIEPSFNDVELLHKSADIITLPIDVMHTEMPLAELYIESSALRPSKLSELDEKALNEKLSLFT